MKRWMIVVIFSLIPTLCLASSATERLIKAFNIKDADVLDEYILREAILKAIPIGSSIDDVLKRLKFGGLDFQGTCFPGDESAVKCSIQSSRGTRKDNDPNFNFYFVFDDHNKVTDVVVTRWYRDIAKTFITTYKKPDNSIKLKSGLGIGSTVADFEKVYGRWEVDEVGAGDIGWPFTITFYSLDNKEALTVGIDLGELSRKERNDLKSNQSRLRTMPVGIILFVK